MAQIRKEKKILLDTDKEQGRSRRVLVAEDNKNVQAVLAAALSSMGFDVSLAGDGIEALTFFLESSFDLVLTDLQMPLMDGSTVAHFIKERSPNTPVILLTGADRETVWNKVQSGCIDSIISKPFKLDDFKKAIQGALGAKQGEQESKSWKTREIRYE
jgi:two-component system, cell cycle response regulator CpdR